MEKSLKIISSPRIGTLEGDEWGLKNQQEIQYSPGRKTDDKCKSRNWGQTQKSPGPSADRGIKPNPHSYRLYHSCIQALICGGLSGKLRMEWDQRFISIRAYVSSFYCIRINGRERDYLQETKK